MDGSRRDLVLIGGGHAHVQVLRRVAMRPVPGVRVTAVLDRPEAVYSGMVPGFVAGDYAAHDLEIDVVPLARRARARVVLSRAVRVDPAARKVEIEGRPPLGYDAASLDVGSTVRGLELPGVAAHALATRPIRGFVDALEARLAGARARRGEGPLRIAVVGGGVAGLELAFALRARSGAELCVFDSEPEIPRGYAGGAQRRVRELATRRGIGLHRGRCVAVEADGLVLEGGERIAADLVVWATGAAPPELLRESGLALDGSGFVRVDETLQVEGADGLFAAGDCAALIAHPWVPKAGVYAVRQGPFLDANLRAYLAGRPLRAYRPQRDFLSLMNLGGRSALGHKWGVSVSGPSVWRLKDRIDRRFMRRFQVLAPGGAEAPDFPTRASMGMEQMPCGGCAAKLGAAPLSAALARLGAPLPDARVLLGLARPDDAAALRTRSGDVVLATVDAFRAFSDDPWLVGRVAAINAASDVWAKGGTPRFALAFVHGTEQDPARAEEQLFQVLAGVRAALDAHGITLVGGHTTHGSELLVGLTILGDAPEAVPALSGLVPGERLILTKALGSGVLLAADMQGLVSGPRIEATWLGMLRANAEAARIARAHGARACTDVSGFGLAGHLSALLRESGVGASIDLAAIPALDGALELLARGVRSTYHEQNAAGRRALAVAPGRAADPRLELLFDPQTSGGLLFGVAPERAGQVVRELRACGDTSAAEVGEVVAGSICAISVA